jgi:tetratricopeptide (TPR) repeat protein
MTRSGRSSVLLDEPHRFFQDLFQGVSVPRPFSRRLTCLAAALLAAMVGPNYARADKCSDAVEKVNKQLLDGVADFAKHFNLGSGDEAKDARYFCDTASKQYNEMVAELPRARNAEAACGSRLRTKCGASCIEGQLPDLKAEMTKKCSEADRLGQPVEKLRSICIRGYLHDDARTKACSDLAATETASPEERAQAYLYVAGSIPSGKDPQRELKIYNDALRVHPGDEQALLLRGLYYSIQNYPDLALQDFSDGIKANPKSAKLRVERAHIYESNNAFDQAIAELTDAISFSAPEEVALVYDERAKDYMYKGDYKQAIAEYKAMASMNDDFAKMLSADGIKSVADWQKLVGSKPK